VIFFCGDTHGQLDHVIRAVQAHRPNAIVLLGDIQAPKPLDQVLEPILDLTEVWFIHGNHDTDSAADHDHLFTSGLAERNLHGRVVTIDGMRVAGLGGVFRQQVWMPPQEPIHKTPQAFLERCGKGNWWRGGLPRKHRSTIFPSDLLGLHGSHADILVSHEAASAHMHGFSAIDELGRALGVTHAFHGHHHERCNYGHLACQLGFHGFGVALREIVDQHGHPIDPV
jgi:hypothetical protein